MPEVPSSEVDLGHAHYKERRYDEAISCFERVLSQEPSNVRAAFLLGMALEDTRRFEEAIAAYERCLSVEPAHYKAATNIGEALRKSAQYARAIDAYDRALKLQPEYLYALAGRAECLRMLGGIEESLSWYGRALAVGPRHAFAVQGKAAALHALGRCEEALPVWKLALDIEPNSSFAKDGLLVCERVLAEAEKRVTSGRMPTNRLIVCGAAGRDFHDFLVLYRDDPNVEVVAFTAAQIPYIEQRTFPAALAGPRYPSGIPIFGEERLVELIGRLSANQVAFAYSDVSEEHLSRLAASAIAAGADFVLPGARSMIPSRRKVIGVGAVRTGCGKSQTSRYLMERVVARGLRAVAIRHPMPYDPDLASQAVQRFATREDLVAARCTIEEREEYEPYVERGRVVYSGVDYRGILARAEEEADLILWDGGNNDLPLIRPDLYFVLTDPHRPGHTTRYFPSRAQLLLADVVLIAKTRSAPPGAVLSERELVRRLAPRARTIAVDSVLTLQGAEESSLRGKRVVVVEDGPTTTHGGMAYGAATLLARRAGAEIVDPRPAFVGELAATLAEYPDLGPLIPAVGYSDAQRADLAATLGRVDADVVLSGTPIDLGAVVPDPRAREILRVRYDLEELPGERPIDEILDGFLG